MDLYYTKYLTRAPAANNHPEIGNKPRKSADFCFAADGQTIQKTGAMLRGTVAVCCTTSRPRRVLMPEMGRFRVEKDSRPRERERIWARLRLLRCE